MGTKLIDQFIGWSTNLSDLDAVIIAFGTVLVVLHLGILSGAIGVRRPITHARLVGALRFGSFCTELLPLLGILGTVLALLLTLNNLGTVSTFDVRQVTRDFAPALSTTVSGLVFAIINMLLNALGMLMLKENLSTAS